MTVRIQLKNTKKFINVEEEVAEDIQNEETASAASLEETMTSLETKNSELQAVQAEVEELKGELSVYKEKLDELLSTEAVEHAAMDMMAEADEGTEILENSLIVNEEGIPVDDDEKKQEIKNSCRGIFGDAFKTKVLNSVGVKTEGMTREILNGAFKGQLAVARALKVHGGLSRKVAGEKIFNSTGKTLTTQGAQQPLLRSALERMGFAEKK